MIRQVPVHSKFKLCLSRQIAIGCSQIAIGCCQKFSLQTKALPLLVCINVSVAFLVNKVQISTSSIIRYFVQSRSAMQTCCFDWQ